MKDKVDHLRDIIQSLEPFLVAFSGGVDSSVIARLAKDYCSRVMAVTALSKTNPSGELESAKCVAEEMGVEWRIVEVDELADEKFRANPPNRCYYCKKGLMNTMLKLMYAESLEFIVDGTNADDLKDFRPGALALKELDIKSPLA